MDHISIPGLLGHRSIQRPVHRSLQLRPRGLTVQPLRREGPWKVLICRRRRRRDQSIPTAGAAPRLLPLGQSHATGILTLSQSSKSGLETDRRSKLKAMIFFDALRRSLSQRKLRTIVGADVTRSPAIYLDLVRYGQT